ncbi:hypothetical protein H0H81_000747 [Sphagnurus paluster]|uniref:Uncharacterized protein n=1 Tax=Sphagnurus paluster TaxID=117069 RepID=A0A9P7GHH5_9AGAR|nr:hypothetical protein H0H81_000747 [Sphagnurus paluster]
MSDDEFLLWEGVLRVAVGSAGPSISPTKVVDRILQRIGDENSDALVSFPKAITALLRYFDPVTSDSSSKLLGLVERSLISNYPPQPEKLATCLEILHLIGRVIGSTPARSLLQTLSVMEKSLCSWIGDEASTLLVAEHDVLVKVLYCGTLDVLRKIPLSAETLVALSPLLSAGFGRLTLSAMGPLAFADFWRATYHGIEEYRASYPDCLKACLLGLADAYGGSLADGLSAHGESQLTVMSTVPDSQPSQHDEHSSRQFYWFSSPVLGGRSLSPPEMNHELEPPVKRRRLDFDQSTAFKQLEDYSSFQEDKTSRNRTPDLEVPSCTSQPQLASRLSSARSVNPIQVINIESPFGLSTPRSTPQGGTMDYRTSSPPYKRPSPDCYDHKSQKRRKTEPSSELPKPASPDDPVVLGCSDGTDKPDPLSVCRGQTILAD